MFQYSFPTPLSCRAAFEESRLRAPVRLLCWFEDALTAWLLRRADLALLISEAMAERWRERGVTRAVSFPLGADTSVEPSSVEPVDLPPETVIYFGSMDAKRRLGFLLEVFARVLETRPEAHLVMLGDPGRGGLAEQARSLGLSERVSFPGRVPRSEVPRYLCAARVSVAPIPPEPLYVEASMTKVVESLGLSVPVVASSEIHDQRELIESSGGGLCPRYDREAFARALCELLGDPAGAARRGAAGRRYVLEHRSYAVLSRRLAEHYDRVLAGSAPAPPAPLR